VHEDVKPPDKSSKMMPIREKDKEEGKEKER
jgi:hypothetical protein